MTNNVYTWGMAMPLINHKLEGALYSSLPDCCHYIWTSADGGEHNYLGRKLSEEEYNKLLNELEIL